MVSEQVGGQLHNVLTHFVQQFAFLSTMGQQKFTIIVNAVIVNETAMD